MVTTALGPDGEDCALRALNSCDGTLARRADGSDCLCFCANRDLTAAVGWTGASEGYERSRLDELARQVLKPHQRGDS